MLYKNTVKQKDEFYKEFCLTKRGNKHIFDNKLDPDKLKFSYPDFGYNADFNFKESEQEQTDIEGTGWRRLLGCISTNPKNERVINYINYVNQAKIQKLLDLTNKKL